MNTLIDQRKQIADQLGAADLAGVSLTTRIAIERACDLLNEDEQQQSEGVAFGFGDRSTIVSQEAYSIFLEREKAARDEPAGICSIEVMNGPEGPSLYIGDESTGHRLAGAKPWGGARTVFKFDVAIADLVREAKALATGAAFPCWSCAEPVTLDERADADGNCPHCSVELDLEDWPKKEA